MKEFVETRNCEIKTGQVLYTLILCNKIDVSFQINHC
jgi:hypothetical protein